MKTDALADTGDFSVFEGTWCLPEWPELVVPRPNLFKALHEVMSDVPEQQVDANLVRLVGPLGSGKSLLALQYAHQLYREDAFQSVIWLNAQGENASYLLDQWHFLMAGLGLDILGARDQDIQQTYAHLTSLSKTLLVIDDVAEYSVVMPYLRCKDPAVSLLVTTRNGVRWDYRCRDFTMQPMSSEQGVELLQALLTPYPHLLKASATVETAVSVYSHPLFLQDIVHQAMAADFDQVCPMQAYGTQFKAGAIFYQLQKETFNYKVLLRLAYLHPHQSIPLSLILALVGDEDLELEVLDAIEMLKRYGLLSDAVEAEQYFLSSIVGYLMRDHLPASATITLVNEVLEVLVTWLGEQKTATYQAHCCAVMQEGLRWVQRQQPQELMARRGFFADNHDYQVTVPKVGTDGLQSSVRQYNQMITGESDCAPEVISRALFNDAK